MKSICVVTGSRAEFGLLKWVIDRIHHDPDLELRLAVTGSHFLPHSSSQSSGHSSGKFDKTIHEVREQGYPIHFECDPFLDQAFKDSGAGISQLSAYILAQFGKYFEEHPPHLVVVLGDRFEILDAAFAATFSRIALAHIHGGELSFGSMDDSIRHCLTKLSHFHFVAAENYRKRVIQMGEAPERVFNVGAVGLEAIKKEKKMSREELCQTIDFPIGKTNLLVTYHPPTAQPNPRELPALLEAIHNWLSESKERTAVFTLSSADRDVEEINAKVEAFAETQEKQCAVFKSLGHFRYTNLMIHSEALVGNSSSGIIEAPFLKKPSVNIGPRQDGRLRADSVVDVAGKDSGEILRAIETVTSPSFREGIRNQGLYGEGESALEIVKVIKEVGDSPTKQFHDLVFSQ